MRVGLAISRPVRNHEADGFSSEVLLGEGRQPAAGRAVMMKNRRPVDWPIGREREMAPVLQLDPTRLHEGNLAPFNRPDHEPRRTRAISHSRS